MIRILSSFLLLLILTALAFVYGDINLDTLFSTKDAGKATFIAIDSKHKPGKLNYSSVKTILDNRCASCHSGADAPCQLQLGSYEGLQRGASKQPLYENRLHAIAPSRLMVDGKTAEDWRTKGFFPVLNEKSQFPEINLNNSLVAKFLVLKHDNPLSGTDEKLQPTGKCPSLEEFPGFAQAHPLAGMPYALPGLDKAEQDKLMNWLQDGAKNSPPAALPEAALAEIGKWEQFLNDPAPQMQLTARYIYEHLSSGHLHFKGQPAHEFYRLVRSKTAPGQAIEELASLHPYLEASTGVFAYRLLPVNETLTDKSHAVYELSDGKMARIRDLFLKPAVAVAQLPAYPQEGSAQPFTTFKDLPVDARYQFLLDDAHFFLQAIFKSPALNRHDGLNGLRDQFWVAFLKPRPDTNPQTAQFLSENQGFLRLPASAGEAGGLAQWFELKALQKQYLANKATFTQTVLLKNQALDLGLIWTGEGGNGDALLTVFRHDDNASVVKGLQGKTPSTAWVIDYPLFERLHYLLSAGFNPYGGTTHYLATRLTLDLLRSEAENDFLQFLPKSVRQAVHADWYPDSESQWLGVFNTPDFAALPESAIAYGSQDYPNEFFNQLAKISVPASASAPPSPAQATLPSPCPQEPCAPLLATPETAAPSPPHYDNFARQLAEAKGQEIAALPEVSFLRISTASDPSQNVVYTLIRNRQLSHVGVLLGENHRRLPEQDTLSVLPGFVGSYPNQFFTITSDQMEAFITQLKQAKTGALIAAFRNTFGVSRKHPQFWTAYDSFNQQHRDGKPENAGIFDLGRYQN